MSVLPMTNINLVADGTGETLKVGPITIRVMEDGSRTDNRIGAVEIIIPPRTAGPPQHWHEMHDETFLVTSGDVQFQTGDKIVDAKTGDYVVVPPRAPHTFSNPFEKQATVFNTFTPAYYVQYFRLLDQMTKESREPLDEEDVLKAMARYATLPTDKRAREIVGGKGKAFGAA